MARHVFDNDMTIHVWAQNNQAKGQNAKRSIFFEHGTLYSYGYHYVVGHIMPDGAVLLNDDSNSPTTNRHRSSAWSATRHRTQFKLPALGELLPTYFAPLRLIAQADRNAEDKARAKQAIAAYVAKHALALGEHAGAYLLGLAGISPSKRASRFLALRKAAQRKADKEAAEAKARAEANAYRRGKAYAEMSATEWKFELGDISDYRLDSWLKEARRYAAALKRKGATRLAATLAARVKAARDEHAFALGCAERRNANRWRKEACARIRVFAEKLAAGAPLAAMGATAWEWSDLCGAFKTVRKVTPRLTELHATAKRMGAQWEAEETARRAAEYAERERVRNMKEEERRAAWLAGSISARCSDESGGALLRVNGDTLETSHGASVPLAHAIRAFRFIKLCRSRAAEWSRNGRVIRVGHFTVDHIAADGSFRAGCHSINWPEVERIARLIGVYDDAPDAEALESAH